MLRVVEHACRTDTGRQRTANEDSFYAQAPVFAIADGMGGAQAGEVASRIAAESFDPVERAGKPPESYLRAIAERANERIHELAEQDSSHSGMGTTLTAALLEGDEVSFAHVGDSRAYAYRDGELRLLTTDHSLVEELRRRGRLTEAQAQDHPQRSIITRALGPEEEVEVDTLTFSARPGDVFLLCSDGLTTMVKSEEIASTLAEHDSLDAVAAALVERANEAGGRDNITVVAFRVEEGEEVADSGATLIGPSAEEAGLDAERIRAQAAPRREDRGGTKAPRRRRRTVAKVLVGLVIVAAIGAGAVLGARQVYFLGVDDGGRVALYRGLPYELPFDVNLYSPVSAAPVQADSLPADRRDEATDHELRFHDDAADLLDDLEAAAVTPLPQPPPAAGAGAGGSRDGGTRRQAGAGGKRRGGSG